MVQFPGSGSFVQADIGARPDPALAYWLKSLSESDAEPLDSPANQILSGPMIKGLSASRAEGTSALDPGLWDEARFLVLVCVISLVGLVGFAALTSSTSQPLLLTLLAMLASLDVFFLFGLAAGHVRVGARSIASDLDRAAFDSQDHGIVVTRRDGEVLHANRSFRDLVGGLGQGDISQVLAQGAATSGATEAVFRLSRAAERGERLSEEIRWQSPGSAEQAPVVRTYEVSVVPVTSELVEERRRLVLWEITDVTFKRLGAERAMAPALLALGDYAGADLGLVVLDAAGRIIRSNRAFSDWLSLTEGAERRTRTLAECLSPASRRELLGATGANVPAQTAAAVAVDLVAADGQVIPALLSARLRSAGAEQQASAGAAAAPQRDQLTVVTLQRRAVARSRRAGSSQLAASIDRLLQDAPVGFAAIDRDGRVLVANRTFARLAGGGSEASTVALAGKPADEVLTPGASEATRHQLEALIRDAVAGATDLAAVDFSIGEKADVPRQLQATPTEPGSEAAAILTLTDASERKALERQLFESQKMESIATLAGGMAHNFNNSLQSIIGFSDLLLRTLRPGDPAHKTLMSIKSSATRAAEMVAQLLAFTRRQKLELKILKVGEVLAETIVIMRPQLSERIDIKIESAFDLWYVKSDSTQLQHVLMNLAKNARDALPEGGRLSLRAHNVSERESQSAEARGLQVGEYVLIEVADTGTGMPPDVLAKIFEPYFTTKDVGKGTGLGLASAYGTIKQMGGFIFADSVVGRGTTFRIYLPRYIPSEAEEKALLAARAKPREARRDLTGSGRLLLVEDEDGVRAFAAQALRQQGYEVIEASTGGEALEVIAGKEDRIDIVLSDVIMPEMDGPTLLKALRTKRPELKFIFMSGYPDDAFSTSLAPDTPFAFIQKPFSLADLAAKVKDELAR